MPLRIAAMCLAYLVLASSGTARSSRSASCRVLSHMGVLTAAGSTTDTLMPHGRTSLRSDSPIASIANLDAPYGPVSCVAALPLIEPMNTIRP